jgi:hypothetical protein
MASFDFIDGPEDGFHQGANDVYGHAKTSCVRLGVPDPDLTVKAPLDTYNDAYIAAKSPDRTKSAPRTRQAAKIVLKPILINYGKEYLFNNHKVTAADDVAFHIHRKKAASTIYPPNTVPVVVVDISVPRQVTLLYYALPGDQKRMSKPEGATKFVAYYGIFDTPPTIDQLVKRKEVSSGPMVIPFEDKDRGKTVYIVTCWAIDRDDLEGPKGEVITTFVP